MSRRGSLVGQPAPRFRLRDQDGRWLGLDDLLADGPVVLAFYPRDLSFVCTRQLCGYSDAYESLSATGARIVGISPDPPSRHREFIDAKRLGFQLLSDPDKSVFRAYGVVPRMFAIQTRALFVVGRDGRVLYEKLEPTALTHRAAPELLTILRSLEAEL